MIHYRQLGSANISRRSTDADVEWGISYGDGNEMAEVDERGRDIMGTPRRVMTLIPVVLLRPNTHGYFEEVDFTEVPPEQIRLPVLQTVDPVVTVRLQGTRLDVVNGRTRAFFTVPLDARTAWFIKRLGNVGLALVDDLGQIRSLSTLSLQHNPHFTLLGKIGGSVDGKAREVLLHQSTKWEAFISASSDPFSGPGLDGDDRLHTFYGDRETVYFPSTFTQSCLICGSSQVSREHCTPKWLADSLELQPVVAGVLCEDCNGKLGSTLEAPVSHLYKNGELGDPIHVSLMNRWMVKTAATLGAAANLGVPEPLRKSIETGNLDPSLLIWAKKTTSPEAPYYRFRIVRFTAQHDALGWFIVSFEFPGFAFAVAHLPSVDIGSMDWFPMTFPHITYSPDDTADISKVVLHLMKTLGSPIEIFTDASGKQPAPRTTRSRPKTTSKATDNF